MEPASFYKLLMRVESRITKIITWFKKPLELRLKLAITLRHLTTGDSYRTFMYGFRVAHSIICDFVPEVCQVIIDDYASDMMPFPTIPTVKENCSLVLDRAFTI